MREQQVETEGQEVGYYDLTRRNEKAKINGWKVCTCNGGLCLSVMHADTHKILAQTWCSSKCILIFLLIDAIHWLMGSSSIISVSGINLFVEKTNL
jgi:hypothetical protein